MRKNKWRSWTYAAKRTSARRRIRRLLHKRER